VALSGDLTSLTIARGVQAVGAGAALPVAMAIATSVLPVSQRPLGLGAMAGAAEAGGVLGPLWGGSLTSLAGWQSVFWINLPLCLPLAYALWRLAPPVNSEKQPIDYLGAVLLGGSLALLAVALTNDPIQPRQQIVTLGLYAGAALFFVAFLVRQTQTLAPILQLARLARRPLSAALTANGLLGAALLVAMVDVPLFTNTVLNQSALDGGLNLMRLSATLAVGAFVGGALASRFGLATVTAAGAAIAGAGYLGMSTWNSHPTFLEMTLPLATSGLGFGLVIAPLTTAVMDQVEESERATWAAVLTVARLLGALVAVALLTSRGLGGFYSEAGLVPLDDPRFVEKIGTLQVDAYHNTFVAAAIVCFLAVLPALLLSRKAEA
jgi:MFS family permease